MTVAYMDWTNLADRHTREYHPVIEQQEHYEMPSFARVREAKDGRDGNATKDGYYLIMKYAMNWSGTGALAKSPATLRTSRHPKYKQARIRPTFLQSFMQLDMPSIAETGNTLGDGIGMVEEALSDAATMLGFYKELLFWGDGTGCLATANGASVDTVLTVDALPGTLNLRQEMCLDSYTATSVNLEGVPATPVGIVSDIDEANNQITFNAAPSILDNDTLYIYDTYGAVFDGIRKLIDDGTVSATVMNITTTDSGMSFFKSRVLDAGNQTLSIGLLEKAYNIVSRRMKNARQQLEIWSNESQQSELFVLNAAQKRYNSVDITAGPPKGGVKYVPGKQWMTATQARPDEIYICRWADLIKKTVKKTGASQWPSGGGWQRSAGVAAIENFLWSGEATGIVSRKRSLKIKSLAANYWN